MPAPDPPDPSRTNSRYLTAAVAGIGGRLKDRPEDFLVEEIPAYEPCGDGEHIYLFVEKRNHSTMNVVRTLAEHFGVRRDAVGFAGLKDKVAVTRQLFSVHVPGKKPEDFPALERQDITVHWIDRHTNKLRRGHLVGNRFIIRVRGVDPSKIVQASRSLAGLARSGVPNRIGEQRFGHLQNNHFVGRMVVLGDHKGLLDVLLGSSEHFPDAQSEGRALYAAGKFEEALHAFPRSLHTERRVLAALARGAQPKGAVRAIERMAISFYVTALQSAVFNTVLDRRLAADDLHHLFAGDLAFKHDSGAIFAVTPDLLGPELEARVTAFEVSASGPMWGHRMMRASGEIDDVEVAALAEMGLTPADFERYDSAAFDPEPGQRRPLRVRLTQPDIEAGVDEHGSYVKCVFELPRGSFATTVMDEIMKVGEVAAAGEDDEDDE